MATLTVLKFATPDEAKVMLDKVVSLKKKRADRLHPDERAGRCFEGCFCGRRVGFHPK
jgi:hypothetical protein